MSIIIVKVEDIWVHCYKLLRFPPTKHTIKWRFNNVFVRGTEVLQTIDNAT